MALNLVICQAMFVQLLIQHYWLSERYWLKNFIKSYRSSPNLTRLQTNSIHLYILYAKIWLICWYINSTLISINIFNNVFNDNCRYLDSIYCNIYVSWYEKRCNCIIIKILFTFSKAYFSLDCTYIHCINWNIYAE